MTQKEIEDFLTAFCEMGAPPLASDKWPVGNPQGTWLTQFFTHYLELVKAVQRLEKVIHLGKTRYEVGGPVLVDPKPAGGPDTAPPPPPPKVPPR